MIPLEKQVTSSELSEQLKELGIKQDGLYSYFQYDKWNILLRETKEIFAPNNECGCNKNNLICSAPTDAELDESLPFFIFTSKIPGIPSLGYRCTFDLPPSDSFDEEADTGVNAKAKMLIHLIKDKTLEANEK